MQAIRTYQTEKLASLPAAMIKYDGSGGRQRTDKVGDTDSSTEAPAHHSPHQRHNDIDQNIF